MFKKKKTPRTGRGKNARSPVNGMIVVLPCARDTRRNADSCRLRDVRFVSIILVCDTSHVFGRPNYTYSGACVIDNTDRSGTVRPREKFDLKTWRKEFFVTNISKYGCDQKRFGRYDASDVEQFFDRRPSTCLPRLPPSSLKILQGPSIVPPPPPPRQSNRPVFDGLDKPTSCTSSAYLFRVDTGTFSFCPVRDLFVKPFLSATFPLYRSLEIDYYQK